MSFPRPLLPPAYFVTEPDLRFEAVTDVGRIVPLFFFQPYVFPIEGQQLSFRPESEGDRFLQMAEQAFLANTRQNVATLTRVTEPSTRCNCHGWTFTAGKFLIQDAHVAEILSDNGYAVVSDPRVGDIAVYLRVQLALHSGFVCAADAGGAIRIESKWGHLAFLDTDPTRNHLAENATFSAAPAPATHSAFAAKHERQSLRRRFRPRSNDFGQLLAFNRAQSTIAQLIGAKSAASWCLRADLQWSRGPFFIHEA